MYARLRRARPSLRQGHRPRKHPGAEPGTQLQTRAWGACGSAWSCIQPCSSHSRMAPASCSTEIAQPRNVRTAGRRSKVISMCVRSCPDESTRPAIRSSCYHKAGIPECRSGPFCPPVRCSVERFSLDSSCATMTSESQGRLRRLTQSNVTQVRVQISVGYNRLWSSRATL
jgi:hypothetical protein